MQKPLVLAHAFDLTTLFEGISIFICWGLFIYRGSKPPSVIEPPSDKRGNTSCLSYSFVENSFVLLFCC